MTDRPAFLPEIANTRVVGDVSINYHDVGAGPPVLLIHGSGPGVTAWANWRLVIPELSRRARVIAPDMAGFGYTVSTDPADTTVAGWVRQLIGLMDALGLPRVSIVGNSFGGAIALHTAAAHPARVEKLVLMGAVGTSFPITEGLDRIWGYQPSLEAMRGLMQVFVHDQRLIDDELIAMRYRASVRDDVQQRFAALFPPPRQRWVDALALPDDALRATIQPTLVVHGRQDQVIPFAVSEHLAQLLPNARLHAVERCGHWVQIEHTAEFLREVEAFLFGPASSAVDGLPTTTTGKVT